MTETETGAQQPRAQDAHGHRKLERREGPSPEPQVGAR